MPHWLLRQFIRCTLRPLGYIIAYAHKRTYGKHMCMQLCYPKGDPALHTRCFATCIALLGRGKGATHPPPTPKGKHIHCARHCVYVTLGPLLRPHQNAKHFDVAEGKGRLYVALQRINSSIIACTYAYRRFAYVHSNYVTAKPPCCEAQQSVASQQRPKGLHTYGASHHMNVYPLGERLTSAKLM
jgi:hypothetical protein